MERFEERGALRLAHYRRGSGQKWTPCGAGGAAGYAPVPVGGIAGTAREISISRPAAPLRRCRDASRRLHSAVGRAGATQLPAQLVVAQVCPMEAMPTKPDDGFPAFIGSRAPYASRRGAR